MSNFVRIFGPEANTDLIVVKSFQIVQDRSIDADEEVTSIKAGDEAVFSMEPGRVLTVYAAINGTDALGILRRNIPDLSAPEMPYDIPVLGGKVTIPSIAA